MCGRGQELLDRGSLLGCGYDVVLLKTVVKAVPIFAEEESRPTGITTKVRAHSLKALYKNPNALLWVAAGAGQLGKHTLLLGQLLRGSHVTNDEERRFALESLLEAAKPPL